MRTNRKPTRSSAQTNHRAAIDALEPRQMLADFFGTAGNDLIIIRGGSNFFSVEINGAQQSTQQPVTIYAGAGDDTILLESFRSDGVNNRVSVFGENGNDYFETTSRKFSILPGNALDAPEFDGGPGTDTLIADNTADTTSASILVTFDAVVRTTGTTGRRLEYKAVERLAYLDSSFGNVIQFSNLSATASAREVTISGGSGDDVITHQNFVRLSANIPSVSLHIDAGPGTDQLNMDDSSAPLSGSYVFESNTFTAQGSGVQSGILSHAKVESVALVGTNLGDQADLRSAPVNVALLVELGDGADQVALSGGDLDDSGLFSSNRTLIGGAGTDNIRFDDHLDTDGADETETYTFGVFTLSKGSSLLTYSSFESQTLDAANGGVAPFQPNTINLNAFSGQLDSTIINGGANRPNTVNLGSGQIPIVDLAINLGAAGGAINFNDQSATAARTYQISATEMTSPAPITFTGATSVNLNGGPFNDNFFINGSAAGTAVVASGNLGNDVIRVGGGDFDNMLSPVTVSGNGGDDFIQFNNTLDADPFIATLRNNSFTTGGLAHSYATFETVDIRGGPGGSDLLIQSVPLLTLPALSLTNFTGDSGADLVTLGTGNVGVTGNVSVTGGGGSDTLVLDDSSGTSASTYTFDQGNRFFKGSGIITVVATVERRILNANNGNNTITVDRTTSALTILSNAGNDTVNVLDSTVPVTVNTGGENVSAIAPFGDSIAINTDFAVAGDTPATVVIDQNDAVLGLNIAQQCTLRVASGAVLAKEIGTGSAYSLAGTVDLAGGALLSRAGGPTPAQFRTQIIAGHNGGTWNGTSVTGAINSSLAAGSATADAIGYGSGSEVAIQSIGGFTIAPSDVLIRHTFYGDADLNGVVDFDDYVHIDLGFNTGRTGWTNGDFNYGGDVEFDDFVLIDLAFNTQ